MRWRGERQSDQVEDRRGMTPARGGMAIGGGAEVMSRAPHLVTTARFGQKMGDTKALDMMTDEGGQFAATVLASTEDAWTEIFRSQGQSYRAPTLVLFSDAVASACGTASSAVGPFYCPADQKVYLDLSFYELLSQRFGAPGDFAQAYVVAHEVGHHVQQLLADCLAGVWGNHANRTRQLLEPGDVEEGLRAAAAIGDDMMQRQSAGRVRPESWTHGSSEMRVRWLRQGLSTGDPDQCDTFKAERL